MPTMQVAVIQMTIIDEQNMEAMCGVTQTTWDRNSAAGMYSFLSSQPGCVLFCLLSV